MKKLKILFILVLLSITLISCGGGGETLWSAISTSHVPMLYAPTIGATPMQFASPIGAYSYRSPTSPPMQYYNPVNGHYTSPTPTPYSY